LIRIESGRFLELLANAYDCVWLLVPIDPGYLLTGLHRNGLRIEREVFDLDFVFAGTTAAGVLRIAGVREERQRTDAAQERRNFDFRSECSHRFELLWFDRI
jgi:hypothetical protein